MSVVTNASMPESTLKKKSNSVCYHAVREAVVMGEALVAHIGTAYNLADLFTKALYGQARRFLVGRLMYDVFPYMAKAPTEISLSCLIDRVLGYRATGFFHLGKLVAITGVVQP
jgi:hypothetical protein